MWTCWIIAISHVPLRLGQFLPRKFVVWMWRTRTHTSSIVWVSSASFPAGNSGKCKQYSLSCLLVSGRGVVGTTMKHGGHQGLIQNLIIGYAHNCMTWLYMMISIEPTQCSQQEDKNSHHTLYMNQYTPSTSMQSRPQIRSTSPRSTEGSEPRPAGGSARWWPSGRPGWAAKRARRTAEYRPAAALEDAAAAEEVKAAI